MVPEKGLLSDLKRKKLLGRNVIDRRTFQRIIGSEFKYWKMNRKMI